MSHPRNYFFLEPLWPRSDSQKSQLIGKSLIEEVTIKQELCHEQQQLQLKNEQPLIDLSIKTIYSPELIDRLSIKEKPQIQLKAHQQLYFQSQDASLNISGKQIAEQEKQVQQSRYLKLQTASLLDINQESSMYCRMFSTKSKEKYNILDRRTKQFLVQQTKFMSITQVAKIYGISINNLCRWKKSCQRRAGAGRKVTNMQMERTLIEWIQTEQTKNGAMTLSRKAIQEKAKELAHCKIFKASKGWFERFAKRNSHLGLMPRLGEQYRFDCNNIPRPITINMIRSSATQMRTRSNQQRPVSKKHSSE